VHVDHSKSEPTDDKLSLKEACSLSRDLFFWKISNNISKTVQDSFIKREMKDFSRSQAVTYTVNVVIS